MNSNRMYVTICALIFNPNPDIYSSLTIVMWMVRCSRCRQVCSIKKYSATTANTITATRVSSQWHIERMTIVVIRMMNGIIYAITSAFHAICSCNCTSTVWPTTRSFAGTTNSSRVQWCANTHPSHVPVRVMVMVACPSLIVATMPRCVIITHCVVFGGDNFSRVSWQKMSSCRASLDFAIYSVIVNGGLFRSKSRNSTSRRAIASS